MLSSNTSDTSNFWGDTLTQQRISIYRLKSPIVLDNDEDLYNSTVLPTEDAPLFSFTFMPRCTLPEMTRT